MKDGKGWHAQSTVLQRVGQNLVIEQQKVSRPKRPNRIPRNYQINPQKGRKGGKKQRIGATPG